MSGETCVERFVILYEAHNYAAFRLVGITVISPLSLPFSPSTHRVSVENVEYATPTDWKV